MSIILRELLLALGLRFWSCLKYFSFIFKDTVSLCVNQRKKLVLVYYLIPSGATGLWISMNGCVGGNISGSSHQRTVITCVLRLNELMLWIHCYKLTCTIYYPGNEKSTCRAPSCLSWAVCDVPQHCKHFEFDVGSALGVKKINPFKSAWNYNILCYFNLWLWMTGFPERLISLFLGLVFLVNISDWFCSGDG